MAKKKQTVNTENDKAMEELQSNSQTAQDNTGCDREMCSCDSRSDTNEEKEQFEQKLAEVESQLNETKDAMLRLQADFDNYRKRNALLRIDSLNEGRCSVIIELLKSIDNFERALLIECSDESYASGMKMIHKMMLDTLVNMGLEEIKTDCGFDPNIHEAVMQEEKEGAESGQITVVLQKGYKFNGKVIRPAMVKVAK